MAKRTKKTSTDEPVLYTRDVVAEAKAICVELGIDPYALADPFGGGKLPATNGTEWIGDGIRQLDPTLPNYAGYMDEAAHRLTQRMKQTKSLDTK